MENTLQLRTEIVSKAQQEVRAHDLVRALLERYPAVDAYVILKQIEKSIEFAVAQCKPQAILAWTGLQRVGAATVDLRAASGKRVWSYDEETTRNMAQEYEIIAGCEARIEAMKKIAVENGTATAEKMGGESIVVSFDKI